MLAPLQVRKETHDGSAPLLGLYQRRILRHLGAQQLFPMRPSQLRHVQLAKVMYCCFSDSLNLRTYRFVYVTVLHVRLVNPISTLLTHSNGDGLLLISRKQVTTITNVFYSTTTFANYNHAACLITLASSIRISASLSNDFSLNNRAFLRRFIEKLMLAL